MASQSLITYTNQCHWLHITSLLLLPLDQEMEWQRQFSMGKRIDWRLVSNLHNSLLSTEHESYLMQRANLLEMTLVLGKIEGRRKRGWQRMIWLNDINDSMDMNLNKLWEMVKDREAWRSAAHGVTKSRTWLIDWTTSMWHVNVNLIESVWIQRWCRYKFTHQIRQI